MYLIGFVLFRSEYLNQPYTTHFTTYYTTHYINAKVKKMSPLKMISFYDLNLQIRDNDYLYYLQSVKLKLKSVCLHSTRKTDKRYFYINKFCLLLDKGRDYFWNHSL